MPRQLASPRRAAPPTNYSKPMFQIRQPAVRMDSRDGNVQQNHPILCKNGCGFYSNTASEGLCSLCYKDIVKKKQAPPTNMPASLGGSV